ncbi:MAG TPA: hypothetical protein VIV59_02700 [Anaeromyxobacteraceae bacterium]
MGSAPQGATPAAGGAAPPGARFDEALARFERELDLPYPERAELLDEIAADLEAAYAASRRRGLAEAEARAAALREVAPDGQALAALAEVHRPAARRALERLPRAARALAEPAALAFPFVLVVSLLASEVPLVLFLREGGAATVVVLALGGLALLLDLERAFRWFVLRDHSTASLAGHTGTPLYLAAAAALAGLGGTALNAYLVLARSGQGLIPVEAVPLGLRESLSCAVTGLALSTLSVLLHGAVAAGRRALRLPEAPPRS